MCCSSRPVHLAPIPISRCPRLPRAAPVDSAASQPVIKNRLYQFASLSIRFYSCQSEIVGFVVEFPIGYSLVISLKTSFIDLRPYPRLFKEESFLIISK